MNKRFVNQMNRLAERNRQRVHDEAVHENAQKMVPQFYAAMIIALCHLYDFTEDELTEIINETMNVWNTTKGEHLANRCRDETGIYITLEEEN